MDKKSIEVILDEFSDDLKKGSEDLGNIRKTIFDSFDNKEIREKTKNNLLKSLYSIAAEKNIFFMRVMDRVQGLPKTEEDEDSYDEDNDDSEDESYEESYEDSYDEDEEDEDDEDK